jgi:N-acyl homoserine lactone hydrolase
MPELDLIVQGLSVNSDQGNLGFCGITLIRGSRTILVDVAQPGRRDVLLNALRERGLTPADIDAVALTHAHWDHMLNIDLFPNAIVYIHPWEREYAKSPHPEDTATLRYTGLVLEQCKLSEVQEGDEIDDGVRVIHTPGHTRGSLTLVVQTAQGPVNVCGDALPTARTALNRMPFLIAWDEDDARRSAVKILEHSNTLYPGHDKPFRLQGDKVEYLQGRGMTMVGTRDPVSGQFEVTTSPLEEQPIRRLGRALELSRQRPGSTSG